MNTDMQQGCQTSFLVLLRLDYIDFNGKNNINNDE